MASSYAPWSPISGPGYSGARTPAFALFPTQYIGVLPGLGYNSRLGPNNTTYPGPPAPQSDNGILLENNWREFVALETSLGGPASFLTQE